MTWHFRMFLILILVCLSAIVACGLDWGLPSATVNRYLFASQRLWSGSELAGYDSDRNDNALGADVDRNPLDRSRGPVGVNPDDQRRAEILRRYRLFSNQPDEMITFMALRQMKPAQYDFDPRLYQYGGLWIYPVGALLKGLSMVGVIDLRSGAEAAGFYYDHPEAFGRFYIVARAYTLAWYMVLLLTSAAVAKKLTGSDVAALGATALVGVSPVVFALAHEAKPHLPGAALMLLSCWSAARWVEKGRARDALRAGALCGLAAGMILSAATIGIILPVMVCLRRATFARRIGMLLLGIAAFILAYAVTNPFVPINLVRHSSALISNLANTQAMYGQGTIVNGLKDGFQRLIEAASLPGLILFGMVILTALARRRMPSAPAILLGVPAAIVLAQFLALAEGKPSEYARFAMFPAIVLSIAGAWVLSLIGYRPIRTLLTIAAPAIMLALATVPYATAFLLDSQAEGTRTLAANELLQLSIRGNETITLNADPAPYNFPPVDLWQWRLYVADADQPPGTDVLIRPLDRLAPLSPAPPGYRRILIDAGQRPAPITWANKPFEILVRE